MIASFIKTDTEDWKGYDCCRIDFSALDVRSPYFIHCNETSCDTSFEEILEYIKGRKSLGGAILGGEPLAEENIISLLTQLKKTKVPIRIETNGNRPDSVDDIAGALLADSVLLRLFASPDSPEFMAAMPGADNSNVAKTISLLQKLDIQTEIELIAVPGTVDSTSIKEICKNLGKNTVFTIR